MEGRREESVPGVKDFQITACWVPPTPVKPLQPNHQQQIYSEIQENELFGANFPGSERVVVHETVLEQANWSSETIRSAPGYSRQTEEHSVSAYWESTASGNVTRNFDIWGAAASAVKPQVDTDPSLNVYNNMSFGDLLALATTATATANVTEQRNVEAAAAAPAAACASFNVLNSLDLNGFEPGTGNASSSLNSDLHPSSELGTNPWIDSFIQDMNQCRSSSRPTQLTFDLNAPQTIITDGGELSRTITPRFAPVTPDQSKRAENNQVTDVQITSADEMTNRARDTMENNETTSRVEVSNLHENEQQQSQLLAESLNPSASMSLQENHNPDKGANQSSKPRRRRKYVPKVVREGQPKRTRKPATPKPTGPSENPTGKRKYVRKKVLDKSTSIPPTGLKSGTTEPEPETVGNGAKTCRRSINFDFESNDIQPPNLNSELQAQNFTKVQAKSSAQLGEGIEVKRTQLNVAAYEVMGSVNLQGYTSMAEKERTPCPSAPIEADTAHEKSKADAVTDCTRGKCRIVFSNETHDKQAAPRSPNDSNCSTSASLARQEEESGQKRAYSCTTDDTQLREVTVTGTNYNGMQAYLMVPGIDFNNQLPQMHFPEIYKKRRNEKWQISSTSSRSSAVTATENCMRKAIAFPQHYASLNSVTAQAECRFSANQFDYSFNANKTAAANSTWDNQQSLQYMLPLCNGERLTKKRSRAPTRMRDIASLIRIVEGKQQPLFPGKAQYGNRLGFEASQQPHTSMEALMAKTCPAVATKKRTRRNTHVNSMPTVPYNHHQSSAKPRGPSNILSKNMSPLDAIVERLKQLNINGAATQVAYYNQNALVPYYSRYQEQNSLVLYQRDGTIVPFEGSFEPYKKRKPRAKVDLDEETNKVWKLLLENINNEGIDGSSEDKAKWWEEERKVFRGRADSFIARMHLVQGDRRFSQWKGSVVDSVVGVFLTQNVSDHLSSSAYMALAARFPLKSESNHRPCSKDRNGIIIEEPDDTIIWHEEKSNQPISDPSSVILHDEAYNVAVLNSNGTFGSSDNAVESTNNSKSELLDSSKNVQTYHVSKVNKTTLQRQEHGTELDGMLSSQNSVVSSQNSVSSPAAPSKDGIGSCSQSDSNDLTSSPPTKSFANSTSFMELLKMAGTTTLHGTYTGNVSAYKDEQNQANSLRCHLEEQNKQNVPCGHLTNNSGARSIECIDLSEEESGFSNTASENEDKCPSEQSGITESIKGATYQETATASPQEAELNFNNIRGVNELLRSQSLPANNTPYNNESLAQEHINQVQQVLKVPNLSAETSDNKRSNIINASIGNSGHDVDVSNISAPSYLARDTLDKIEVKTSRVTKVKLKTEKPVEWDNLRKQAQANGRKRERTANTMDSMDWEAIRCADVNEIANTIRERGMNNMLAERIKDFLNRLVREHGSIDLEWLRDVPPDKAKEYLLSVRGLGLKSVECVRLLTLHHLAFPVDTNVGRIAVRLGWVPLQPLPESLQLHLLELYPILESIQKYLWPRLCKLDQRTLYELHYQMITFGKVFCTKSKPNCNACPMRGECRHFASAFASARLALPGPEEKGIVCAANGKEGNQNRTGIINPLQLPMPQINYQAGAVCEVKSNEPIIEVPASPEPTVEEPTTPEAEHINVPESDIEDALCEDPEYIPTIELNVKEFAQNLQDYMQNNMELQEADMSKALVALTPEAAAIPTAKLKNMSRLRTEHQVYELPDSHPLLERMDKREPDDPSSYLLAIWTPGETANSIQPPEMRCNSQECGRLCDDTTCFYCNSVREANNQTVRGTILIPCRTAMRGSFPLNGTYFQVNEVFADHDSSINPINVPRSWLWNLPRRTVYFGTSIPTIFKGLTTEGIQYCFWRGFVCVRGFDQKTRAPRPLMARLHFPASKLVRTKDKNDDK